MDKLSQTWPEPGTGTKHNTLQKFHDNVDCLLRVCSVWVSGASGVIQMFSVVLFVSLTYIKDTVVQKQQSDRDVWRDRGNDAATPQRVESFSQVGRRRRFPLSATWRCCCSSALPDLLWPPPHFPSQQPPPPVTSPPSHRILWKLRGRRVSNHCSSQSGRRNKATGSRVVKNILRCLSKLAGCGFDLTDLL